MVTAARIDAALCRTLALEVIRGDARARQSLIEYLWPHWLDLVRRSPSMGSFAASEDHVFNVATLLLAKFGDKESRVLKRYQSWQDEHPNQDFADWVRIVATRDVCSYVRDQLGPRSTDESPSQKRLLNEFTRAPALDVQGVRPPLTWEQTARELIEFASSRLPANQARALSIWLDGGTNEEIDSQLKLPAGHGKRLVRAAIAVLRRHFNDAIGEIDIDDA